MELKDFFTINIDDSLLDNKKFFELQSKLNDSKIYLNFKIYNKLKRLIIIVNKHIESNPICLKLNLSNKFDNYTIYLEFENNKNGSINIESITAKNLKMFIFNYCSKLIWYKQKRIRVDRLFLKISDNNNGTKDYRNMFNLEFKNYFKTLEIFYYFRKILNQLKR